MNSPIASFEFIIQQSLSSLRLSTRSWSRDSLLIGSSAGTVIQIFWRAAAKGDSLGCVSHVTRVIESIQHGDPKAADELLPLVYEELRKLAASKMANEAAGQTLQPTALVHEAWMRLVGQDNPKF